MLSAHSRILRFELRGYLSSGCANYRHWKARTDTIEKKQTPSEYGALPYVPHTKR